MSKILRFINSLKNEQRDALFTQLRADTGTRITENSLRRQISGGQKLSPHVCVGLENLSNGALIRPDMRPNDWHLAWPELRQKYAHLLQWVQPLTEQGAK